MDSMVSVEEHGPISRLSVATRRVRLIALAALAAVLTACGGGGGGGGDGNGGGNPPPDPTGQIAATVVDEFDAPISGATVSATVGSTTRTATTGASGTVTVTQVPTGTASVSASADGFIDSPDEDHPVTEDQTTNVTITLQRVAQATGGVVEALPAAPLGNGTSYTFRLRVVVIDQDFEPVEGLTAGAFTLEDCTPVVESPENPDCVRDSTANFDAAYTVTSDTPANFAPVPAGTPVPYAAALLLDSSGSIRMSDPTDARIFASKVFLGSLSGGDQAMLSAFADDNPNPGGNDSLLPMDLTVFPCATAPCPPPAFVTDGESLFPSLDDLATLEAGGTPLYFSLSEMINIVRNNAPAAPADLRRAVVLFSDGEDIYCAENGGFQNCTDERQAAVDLSRSQPVVDIFTIGLTDDVNHLAMAELALGAGGAYMFAENTEQLIPIYGSLGRLLSNSLPTYEMEWTVENPGGELTDGRAVLGRLTVDTGATTFELPFVVQIFEL